VSLVRAGIRIRNEGILMPDIKTDDIEMLHAAIKEQYHWDMILMLHDFFVAEGFSFKINPKGKIAFSYKSRKEFLLWRDSSIKVRLLHIEKYEDMLIDCTDNVKNTIINALDCHNCGADCNDLIDFTYNGKKYSKCNPKKGYINFEFLNLLKDDVRSIIELSKHEIPYYKRT